jgi:hypothetical protein
MTGILARIMRSITAVRLAVLTLLVIASWSGTAARLHAQEQEDSAVCSVATLKGAYGFFRTGATAVGPLAAVGIGTFDGTGAVSTARQTIRKNGVTTSDLFTDPAVEGSYEVDPDCAARFLSPDGSVFAHAVIVDGGNELFIMSLSNGNSVYGVMKKISKRQH